jgi:hypothetical protein
LTYPIAVIHYEDETGENMPRLIIVGGRNYIPKKVDEFIITSIVQQYGIDEIVSGGAGGADEMGERYAKSFGLEVHIFPAQWGQFGKSAGPIRNKKMAEYSNVCLLFPGGKGTADMKRQANKAALPVIEADKWIW